MQGRKGEPFWAWETPGYNPTDLCAEVISGMETGCFSKGNNGEASRLCSLHRGLERPREASGRRLHHVGL